MDFIEIPRDLKRSNCLEWKTRYDKFNFLYLYIRHLFPEETVSVVDFRQMPIKYLKKFNIRGFKFPLQFCNLKKFLNRNSHLPISISVFYESEGQVSKLGFFTNKNNNRNKNILNLLMIKYDPEISLENESPFSRLAKPIQRKKKSSCKKIVNCSSNVKWGFSSKFKKIKDLNQQHHFFKITKIQGFLNNRAGLLSGKKAAQQKHIYCEKCLLHFRSKSKKEKHENTCCDKQRAIYPSKNSSISFTNHKHKFHAPVVGFCDFECVLQRNKERSKCQLCLKTECLCAFPTSDDINVHRPVGYSLLFVDSNDEVFFQEEYVGEDAAKHFLDRMHFYEKVVDERKQKFRHIVKNQSSPQEWQMYQKAKVCHICGGQFKKYSRNYRKVLDHDHVTGKIMGAAHSLCNLTRSGPFHTPIFFHNAQG